MNTVEKEILAISRQFKIPVKEIKEVLNKTEKEIIEQKKSKKNVDSISFDYFENEYVLAKNQEEELVIIKKFLPSCKKAADTKLLYDLCPENETGLKKQIIHNWIILCNDLSELREPKRLVEKNSADSELAYQRYKELFF